MHDIEIPEISITFNEAEVVLPAVTVVEEPLVDIEVNPQQYTLTNDSIYLIEQYGKLPAWLKDMIDMAINSNPISTDLDDLIQYVSQLEDGFTHRVDYIENEQGRQLSELTAIKLTNESQGAAIVDLDLVKVTENRSKAISRDVVIAWSTNGSGGAWFDTLIEADRTAISSNASVISSLVATANTQGNAINDAFGSIEDLKKQNDGLIETLFYDTATEGSGPVGSNGELLTNKEPYVTWKADDVLGAHTGDTYVLYEVNASGNKDYIGSWRFGKSESEIGNPTVDPDGYGWIAITDTKSQEAYELALHAKHIGDGKSLYIYDTTTGTPNLRDPKYNDPVTGLPYATADHIGDLWYDNHIIRVLRLGDIPGDDNKVIDGTNPDGSPDNKKYTWVYQKDEKLSIRIDSIDSVTAGHFTVYQYREVEDGDLLSGASVIVTYPKDEIGDDITQLKYGMVMIVKRRYRDYYHPYPDQTTPDGVPYKWTAPNEREYYHPNTGVGTKYYNEVWQYSATSLGESGWVQQESLGLEGTYGVASKLIVNGDGSITGWTMADGSNGSSIFQINADKFIIENSGGTKQPFVIDTTVSPSEMRINADMLVNGRIVSSDFVVHSHPDPECYFDITGFSLNSNHTYSIIGGTILGSKMIAGSLHSYGYNVGGSLDQNGFSLHSCANQNNGYNIIGGSIYGTHIKGTYIESGKIEGAEIAEINPVGNPVSVNFEANIDIIPDPSYDDAMRANTNMYTFNNRRTISSYQRFYTRYPRKTSAAKVSFAMSFVWDDPNLLLDYGYLMQHCQFGFQFKKGSSYSQWTASNGHKFTEKAYDEDGYEGVDDSGNHGYPWRKWSWDLDGMINVNVVLHSRYDYDEVSWVTFYVTNFNRYFYLYDDSYDDNYLSILIYCHFWDGNTQIDPYHTHEGSHDNRTNGTGYPHGSANGIGYTEEDPYGNIEPARISIGSVLKL